MTGGLMAMEMSHTFNMDVTPSFHSANTQADTTAPERAYNISSRSYLSDDRSAMRFVSTSPFNNNNALFERDDYEHMLCNLGGTLTILPGTAVGCPTTPSSQSVGTVVAAGPTFAIFGTSDLMTREGTHVLESYKGDNGDPVFQTTDGLLALKFYDANGQVGTPVKVPFSAKTSQHDNGTGSVNTTTAVFGGLFDAPAGYTK